MIILFKQFDPQYANRLRKIQFHRPAALSLSCLIPIQTAAFSELASFSSITSLTITGECPGGRTSPDIFKAPPLLDTLIFKVKKFRAEFPLVTFLIPQLKELHLHDESGKDIPSISDNIHLPQLRTLGIGFPNSSFFSKVQTPTVKRLILYEPSNEAQMQDEFSQNEINVYGRISHLHFERWMSPKMTDHRLDALFCLRKITASATRLQFLTFYEGYTDGEALISILDPQSERNGAPLLPKLERLIFCRTFGLTQAHCEILRSMGKSLEVY
jgi:hypothetical protein